MAAGRALLRQNRDFRLVWVTQGLSSAGTQLLVVAMPLLVLALTRSAAAAGLVSAVGTVSVFAGGVMSGPLVDRYDRRAVIVVCESARLLLYSGLGVLVLAHAVTLTELVAVEAAGGLIWAPSRAALAVTLARVVPSDQREVAVAADEARGNAAAVLGHSLGGVCFALGHSIPFLLDALTFLASIVGITQIKTSLAPTEDSCLVHQPWSAQLREGLGWLAAHRTFALLALYSALLNLSLGGVQLTVIVLAGAAAHGATVGLVVAAGSVGGILGAVLAPWLIARLGRLHAMLVAFGGMTAMIAALAIAPGAVGLGTAFAMAWLLVPVTNTVTTPIAFTLIPDALLGRVGSVLDLLSGALGAAGPLVAGVLLTRIGHLEPVLLAIPAALASVAIALTPALRTLISAPPTQPARDP